MLDEEYFNQIQKRLARERKKEDELTLEDRIARQPNMDREYCEDLHSMTKMFESWLLARDDWEARLPDKSSDYVCSKCFQITSTKNMNPAQRDEFTKCSFKASSIFFKKEKPKKIDENGVIVYESSDYKQFMEGVSFLANQHVNPEHATNIQQEILTYKRLLSYKFLSKNLFTRRDRPCTCHHCQKQITTTGDPQKSQACFLFTHTDKDLFEDYYKNRRFRKVRRHFTENLDNYKKGYYKSIDKATRTIKESMKVDFTLKGKTKDKDLKKYLRGLKNTLSKEIVQKDKKLKSDFFEIYKNNLLTERLMTLQENLLGSHRTSDDFYKLTERLNEVFTRDITYDVNKIKNAPPSSFDNWITPDVARHGSASNRSHSTKIGHLILGEPAILDDLEFINLRVQWLVVAVQALLPQVIDHDPELEFSGTSEGVLARALKLVDTRHRNVMKNRRFELSTSILLVKTCNKVAECFDKFTTKKADHFYKVHFC